jgi:hypothetical protein
MGQGQVLVVCLLLLVPCVALVNAAAMLVVTRIVGMSRWSGMQARAWGRCDCTYIEGTMDLWWFAT